MLAVLDLGGGSGGGGEYSGPPAGRSAELTRLLVAATKALDDDGNSTLIDSCKHSGICTECINRRAPLRPLRKSPPPAPRAE